MTFGKKREVIKQLNGFMYYNDGTKETIQEYRKNIKLSALPGKKVSNININDKNQNN